MGAAKVARECCAFTTPMLFFSRSFRIKVLFGFRPLIVSTTGSARIRGIRSAASDDKVVILKGMPNGKPVNLGWLLLDTETTASPTLSEKAGLDFLTRLVQVSDKFFHHLVNDNLEVRTSVQIDDETGAAKSGALFTYEAIPRGTVLGFEVAIDDRRANGVQVDDVNRLLKKAFHGLKLLGIGGMGTRGFGRIQLLGQNGEAG